MLHALQRTDARWKRPKILLHNAHLSWAVANNRITLWIAASGDPVIEDSYPGNSASRDIHERKYWRRYKETFQDCLNATSTHHAPGYVVPADDKENARLIVPRIVLDTL